MYLYIVDRRYGSDRVVRYESCVFKEGDYVRYNDVEIVVLGQQIAFPERVTYRRTEEIPASCLVEKNLIGTQALALLHRFVNERFTTYKNALPLFLGVSILQLLIRKKKAKRTLQFSKIHVQEGNVIVSEEQDAGQQLIVCPDLRTVYQRIPSVIMEGKQSVLLHGQTTEKQKAEAFRGIKYGSITTVVCTYSQLFQDRDNLTHIVLLDQHTRRYKNQQDPRYYVPTVIDEMARLYNASVKKTGIYALERE